MTPNDIEVDPRDETIASARNALDRAHLLLSRVTFYAGHVPQSVVAECQAWVDAEYDPDTRRAKPCAHNWKKSVLDDSMGCTRCGINEASSR